MHINTVKAISKYHFFSKLFQVPIHLDLASFQSIRKFSQEILNKYSKIDVLINNAGVSFPLTNSQRTKEGFEMNFGVNHLGHFLLTELLKERLIESAPSR